MPPELTAFLETSFTLPGGNAITVAQILMVLALLVTGYAASRILSYLLHKKLARSGRLRPDAVFALSRLAYWLILVVVVLMALSLLNIPLAAFAFITGAVAIGVGFGAQNIINNFISGWILMTERPIRIDDFLEIDGMHGVVERIGNRSTRIRRVDGVHLLVPNSALLEKTVINWTLVNNEIRTTVRVGVAYGSPVRQVADLFLAAVRDQPEVKDDPEPSVAFEAFGEHALVFDAYFWSDVKGERDLRRIRSDIRFRVSQLFADNDIVIALPQRDVHLDARFPLPVRVFGDDDR